MYFLEMTKKPFDIVCIFCFMFINYNIISQHDSRFWLKMERVKRTEQQMRNKSTKSFIK